MEGINSFKVYFMHLWNYHNETLLCLLLMYANKKENLLYGIPVLRTENLEDVDKFWDSYDLSRLSQENINNLDRSIMSNEIEAVIKGLLLGTGGSWL
jgi:hypothetical protein